MLDVLAELELLREDVGYDTDYLMPTQYAFDTVAGLLNDATAIYGALPDGVVCADGNGGIRAEWGRKGGSRLLLMVYEADSEPLCLYCRIGGASILEYSVTGSRLAELLREVCA